MPFDAAGFTRDVREVVAENDRMPAQRVGQTVYMDDVDADLPWTPEIRERMGWLIEAAARWGWVRAGRATADFPAISVAWTPEGAKIEHGEEMAR